MLLRIVSCLTLFALLEVILEISATTHWVVTENGKIQPQVDTVFEMRQPHDLLSFLNQEKRRDVANALHKSMLMRKATIESQLKDLDTADDVEHRLYSTDPDCILAGKPLADIDVYASIAIDGSFSKGVHQEDYMFDEISIDTKKRVPDCRKTFPLEFSMYTFEHLSSIRNRKNLTQHQEIGLMKHLPPGISLDTFGTLIAHALQLNKTSWLHLNLASIYWRIKGNAYNALECSRRAIVSAPRQYRDIPLLTTAGILHAAQHPGEAAIILHVAIDYNPSQFYLHLALGHIYVVLGDYTRAIACYDNCLKLEPALAEAKQARHAALCHLKIEKSLMSLHRHMQDILAELDTYHSQQEEWFQLSAHMLSDQVIKSPYREIRSAILQEYSAQLMIHQTHHQRVEDDSILFRSILSGHKRMAESVQFDIDTSLQLLKHAEGHAKGINHQVVRSKKLHDNNDQLTKLNELPMQNTDVPSIPSQSSDKSSYFSADSKMSNHDFDNELWPKISDCDGSTHLLPDTKQYISVYLPPENKGFETHLFVNKLIDLRPGEKHPLPWYPPICETPLSFDQKYISSALLTTMDNSRSPESILKPFLSNLVQDANLAEIGQRILTATKMKVATPWVLSVLASLHWRVTGKPRNALDCLQLALDQVPEKFKDVPLVSLASINQQGGFIEEAFRIAEEALDINAVEPVTNFLFGTLLHLRGNYSGAISYLKQALRIDVHMYDDRPLTLLRTLACHEKFTIVPQNRPGCDGDGLDLRTSNYAIHLPSGILTKYNLREGDTILCKNEGRICKHIECFATEIDKITGIETWSIHRILSEALRPQRERNAVVRLSGRRRANHGLRIIGSDRHRICTKSPTTAIPKVPRASTNRRWPSM